MENSIYIGGLNYFSNTIEEIKKVDSNYFLVNLDTKEETEIDKNLIYEYMKSK